ncbi:hypothetical protein CUMW_272830 [Citrus unshiu]|uniref:AB hydrolase-1 domain-containing protein n=1 Tax=Citrus unshiu TaxID=55188 RepID=A0A2H5MV78_CITUN|nr:hypothetical protein CUMW_272830 [Citrus unshiu]
MVSLMEVEPGKEQAWLSGASDKPAVVQKPTVLIGNSVGSLACVIAASESSQTLVRGLVLLNCDGGMNNKAIVDDWRMKLLVTQSNILLSIYGNKESVDETLLIALEGVGNCPHDDRPELVHEKLLPWLAETFNF